MAIDKEVENEFGAKFHYHKLRDVRVINDDNIGVQITMTVQSWLDKEARIAGKQPTVCQCIIQGADFAMLPFYTLLKAKFPDFSHGEDDYDNSFKENGEKGPANYTVQTGHGDLIDRWSESVASDESADGTADNSDNEEV